MKNKILIAIGLLLVSVCASAQNYFGVTGGYNLSTMTERSGVEPGWREYSPKSGFNVGIAYEHRFAGSDKGNMFLGANILYSLEGYKFKEVVPVGPDIVFVNANTIDYDGKIDIKLLKIPVSFGYNFQLAEKFGIAPKIFVIYDFEPSYKDSYFAFGGGANFNIGERFSIGIGYDMKSGYHGSFDCGWYDNCHANLTYYIFSK